MLLQLLLLLLLLLLLYTEQAPCQIRPQVTLAAEHSAGKERVHVFLLPKQWEPPEVAAQRHQLIQIGLTD